MPEEYKVRAIYLAPDLRSVAVPNAHRMQPTGARMGEGHHLYKIKGKYYDVSAIPGGTTDQMVARAASLRFAAPASAMTRRWARRGRRPRCAPRPW